MSDPGIDVLCLCKHSSEVNISVMKTHESMDPGVDDLPGPSVQVGLGQYSAFAAELQLAVIVQQRQTGRPFISRTRPVEAASPGQFRV